MKTAFCMSATLNRSYWLIVCPWRKFVDFIVVRGQHIERIKRSDKPPEIVAEKLNFNTNTKIIIIFPGEQARYKSPCDPAHAITGGCAGVKGKGKSRAMCLADVQYCRLKFCGRTQNDNCVKFFSERAIWYRAMSTENALKQSHTQASNRNKIQFLWNNNKFFGDKIEIEQRRQWRK